MSKMERKCSHIIHYDKHERNDPSVRNWWLQLFKTLEDDATISPDRRQDVLTEILPPKVLKRVLSILSIVERQHVDSEKSDEKINEARALIQLPTVSFEPDEVSETDIVKRNVGKPNPYMNFLKRRPDRAAIWYTLPELTLEEMNIFEKADKMTETIATNFIQWMLDIGGVTTLDVPTVIKMFKVIFDTHAATSLCLRPKELCSIPESVASSRNMPEMAKQQKLHRQLRRDIRASSKPKKVIAFGQILPNRMQYHPPKREDALKWITFTGASDELEDMSKVWNGITHLRSTQAFCDYLKEHPEIERPAYLVKMNMFEAAMTKKPRSSITSERNSEKAFSVPSGLLK